jgi:hypothetical protein
VVRRAHREQGITRAKSATGGAEYFRTGRRRAAAAIQHGFLRFFEVGYESWVKLLAAQRRVWMAGIRMLRGYVIVKGSGIPAFP